MCGASSRAITAMVNFTPALRLKDIEYALRLARKLGVACAFGAVAGDLYRKLCELGFAHRQREPHHRRTASLTCVR